MSDTKQSPPSYPAKISDLWLILIIAIVVRSVAMVMLSSELEADPDAYRLIARTLDRTGVYGVPATPGEESIGDPVGATAFRPPFYPCVLSILTFDGRVSSLAVALLHGLLGVATVGLTWDLARQWLGRRLAGLAALFVALDPVLIQQASQVMTETLAAFLATFIWWLGKRNAQVSSGPLAIAIGSSLAIAYLSRPPFLVWAVLWTIWSGWEMIRSRATQGNSSAWKSFVSISLIVGFSVGLWTWRNQRELNHPVWATTHGGYTLLLANNELFYDHLWENAPRIGPLDRRWDAQPFLDRYAQRYQGDPSVRAFWTDEEPIRSKEDLTQDKKQDPSVAFEVHDDQLCASAAKATILRRPWMFAYSCVVRVARFWNPLPHLEATDRPIKKVAVGGIGLYYGFILVAAGIALIRFRLWQDPRWVPALLLAFTLTCIHAVYWSNLRMRAPLTAPLVIAAICNFRQPSAAKKSS